MTFQQESIHGCAILQTFELHHVSSLYCRLLTQAYEEQANGAKEQHVSVTFIQPFPFISSYSAKPPTKKAIGLSEFTVVE